MATNEYRLSHQHDGHGIHYDAMYRHGYYRYQWERIEAPLLGERLTAVAQQVSSDSLLDIACGTGRVTRYAAGFFENVVGMDVSDDMLSEARKRCVGMPTVTFEKRDIQAVESAGGAATNGDAYSCITAFRLFTNADPALRAEAARFAYRHLRPGGVLIANSHVTPRSPLGRLYRAEYLVRQRLSLPQHMFHKVLAVDELLRLLEAVGFSSLGEWRYSALPAVPTLASRIPSRPIEAAEARWGGRNWNQCAMIAVVK